MRLSQKGNMEKLDKRIERRDVEYNLDSTGLRSKFNFARNFYINLLR